MEQFDRILAKHEDQGGILLVDHLKQVAECAIKIAGELGLNTEIARKGAFFAIFHIQQSKATHILRKRFMMCNNHIHNKKSF